MRFAVDTGGTFADLIVDDGVGTRRMFKAPTTPHDPIQGLLNVLGLAAEGFALPRQELLRRGTQFIHGTTHAINALGELYLGHQDVSQDFAIARSWFLRGAELGNSASMYNLGVLYALGRGVVQDEIEAFKWLDLAADTGVGEERDRALRARTLLAERLTPVEVLWAEGRVGDWSRSRLFVSGK